MLSELKNRGSISYIRSVLYLQVKSKNATSGPPIGPALGQCGIPAAPFCKEFNERTLIFKSDVVLFVTLYLFISGEYNFDIRLPSTSFFLMRAVNLKKGCSKPGFFFSESSILKCRRFFGRYRYITPYILYEIFLYKAIHHN